jgi:DNA primase catalytic core
MNATNNVLDDIKRSMRLSDYVNQFTISPLKKSGGEGKFMGFCPLHDNTNSPAFSVDDNRGLWHCFAGCGAGSIIDFWLVQHGYDPHDRASFGMAIEGLATELSVDVPEYKSEKKEISATKIKNVLGDIATAATNYLFDGEDDSAGLAYDYLISRGFTDALIEKYRIGFFPESGRDAMKVISKAAGDDYGMKAAIAGGVVNQSDGSEWTPLYGRIVIPIADRYGHVLGFGAREIPNVKHYGDGKWINPTTTSVYDKSKVLFDGGELARIKKPSSVVICEGYFDAIAITESESPAIGMAVCGTATTPSHLDLLHGADDITFMFDGDDAGMSATSKLTWAINKREDLYAVVLKNDVDPFDVVFGKKGDITISQLVEEAKPLLTVAVDVERERKTKNDDFDKWVANAISSIESDQGKNDLAAIAAKKRGQNRSAYIRNISRINVSSIKYADTEESKIDTNAASIIAFIMQLDDDEKDALFYNLDDEDVLDIINNWLQVSSDLAVATLTAVLFGDPIIKTDITKSDIDREIATLMSAEDDAVDITRPLKSTLALIASNAKPIISHGGMSETAVKRLVGIRELASQSVDVANQKNILALTIDLAIDVARLRAEADVREDG